MAPFPASHRLEVIIVYALRASGKRELQALDRVIVMRALGNETKRPRRTERAERAVPAPRCMLQGA